MRTPEETRELLARIKPAHPDEHLGQSFPMYIHHEDNRQARIRHWEYHHSGGWIPCGDNWWEFPWSAQRVKRSEAHHHATNQRLRDMGLVVT